MTTVMYKSHKIDISSNHIIESKYIFDYFLKM